LNVGRLTEKALTLAVGRGAVVLSQFAINLLLVRWWLPEQVGQFHQIRLMIGVACLLDLGLPIGLLQATAGMDETTRGRLLERGASLTTCIGVLAGICLLVVAVFFDLGPDGGVLPLAGVIVAANVASAALESLLVVKERHRVAGFVSVIAASFGLIGGVAVLLLHPTQGASSAIAAVYGVLAVAAVGRFIALWRESGAGRSLVAAWSSSALAEVWPLVRSSLVISANRVANAATGWIDRAVVAVVFPAATLGYYETGAWEVPFMAVAFGAIFAAIVPEMSEHWAAGRTDDVLAVWKGATARAGWLVLPMWLWAWVWAPELLRLLFTADYSVYGLPVFRTYLLTMPLRVAVYGALLIAMEQRRVLLLGSLLDVVTNVALSVVLAGAIGPVGPALATVIGTYCQIGCYMIFVRRRLGVSIRHLMPWSELGRAFGAASIGVLPTIIARRYIDGDVLLLAVGFVFSALVIGAIGVYSSGHLFLRRDSGGG
jgi:O-antigen/teichoic acid export membrane protein